MLTEAERRAQAWHEVQVAVDPCATESDEPRSFLPEPTGGRQERSWLMWIIRGER